MKRIFFLNLIFINLNLFCVDTSVFINHNRVEEDRNQREFELKVINDWNDNIEKIKKEFWQRLNTEPVEKKDKSGMTPFLLAASIGYFDGVKAAFQKGANIFEKNNKGHDAKKLIILLTQKLYDLNVRSSFIGEFILNYRTTLGYIKYLFDLYNKIETSTNLLKDINYIISAYAHEDLVANDTRELDRSCTIL